MLPPRFTVRFCPRVLYVASLSAIGLGVLPLFANVARAAPDQPSQGSTAVALADAAEPKSDADKLKLEDERKKRDAQAKLAAEKAAQAAAEAARLAAEKAKDAVETKPAKGVEPASAATPDAPPKSARQVESETLIPPASGPPSAGPRPSPGANPPPAAGAAANPNTKPPLVVPAPSPVDPLEMVIEFTDGSVLRARLADSKIAIKTPHGELAVPGADLRKIDCAPRGAPDSPAKIARAIADLPNPKTEVREAAVAELLQHGELALAPLEQTAKGNDAELAARAATVLSAVRKSLPRSRSKPLAHDLVQTGDSRIVGDITMTQLQLVTRQFGSLTARLSDIRSVTSAALVSSKTDPAEERAELPDPGNLHAYEGQIGKVFVFRVTGAASGGNLWGTDVYTTDSLLRMAVVHTGVLKPGETGPVKVRMLPGRPSYPGSARNGVSSNAYGGYGASFEVLKSSDDDEDDLSAVAAPAISPTRPYRGRAVPGGLF